MKNKLHLAMPTKIYSDDTLSESFKQIASHGVRTVLLNIDKDITLEDTVAAYKDFAQLGLKCIQIKSSNMPKSYMDEKHYNEAIDEIKKLSEIGKMYGCIQIELTAGSFRGKKEEHVESAVKFIKESCDIAAQCGQYCTLDFTPKKNPLIKTWQEMTELYEKVEKDNLLININTALLHHIVATDEDIHFLKEKAALIEIEDLEADSWSTDINLGEGIVDFKSWINKTKSYVLKSCENVGFFPAALLLLKTSDKNEIKRTLRYFENILPDLRL